MLNVFRYQPDAIEVRRAGRIGAWLPVAIALCIIARESTEKMGSNHTSSFLRPILEGIFGRFQNENWDALHHLIRKSGHFCGYGLVCLTFLRAWLLTFARQVAMELRTWRIKSAVTAILSTACVASLDEWHQTFLPNRTGLAADVLLDTCGATALCLLIALCFWRNQSD